MAIKIIRQANQTGGNGPEIEQVPPCGIEACHQMQIWNYYNLHKKGIQPKNHGSVFLQLGST